MLVWPLRSGAAGSAADPQPSLKRNETPLPGFVVAGLIVWLNEHKIIRPSHTTQQEIISETLSAERRRLGGLLAEAMNDAARAALAQFLALDNTPSRLAALRQDAKDFGCRQMIRERDKRALLDLHYRFCQHERHSVAGSSQLSGL